MRHAIAVFLYVCAHYLGLNLLLKWWNRGKVRILMYHGIRTVELPTSYSTQVTQEEFDWQLAYIKRHYTPCGSEALGDDSKDAKPYRVMITFDDGLENVYTDAQPVLARHDIKGIVFVLPKLSIERECIWTDKVYDLLVHTKAEELDLTTFELGRHRLEKLSVVERAQLAFSLNRKVKWRPLVERQKVVAAITEQLAGPDYSIHAAFRLMTPEQIRTLAAGNDIEIAPHTQTHQILSSLTPEQQREEVQGCLEQLDQWRVPRSTVFAYPNGGRRDFTDQTVEILRETGIDYAVTTIRGHHKPPGDRYRIRRFDVSDSTSRWEFRAKLSGFYFILAWIEDTFLGGDTHKQPKVKQ
jgi:peptidoglycan/xylan/chitin deacetylase (PgdA/CDA1 family)